MSDGRIRIGVILTELGGMDVRALKYLILFQNTIQSSFEFQFIPVDPSSKFVGLLNSRELMSSALVREEGDRFIVEHKRWLDSQADGYALRRSYPEGIIFLSTCRFSDNYFFIGGNGWDVIALGNWKRVMAPPSIVEFFLTLTLRASIDIACRDARPARHQSMKGCLFDFSAIVSDARYSVLTGYLCGSCCRTLADSRSAEVVQDAKLLLDKKWLGEAMQPTTVSSNVKKLGYDLFHTSGVKQTFVERVIAAAEKEVVANTFKLFFGVLIAVLLLWLGLK